MLIPVLGELLEGARRTPRDKPVRVLIAKRRLPRPPASAACGVLAGPLFVLAFTAIGARRPGYDWRRHAVSSLAAGDRGWLQRANFILAGMLYSGTASGLGRCTGSSVSPRAVRGLVAAAGIGLIGSGVFVTDPVAGFPPVTAGEDGSDDALAGMVPTRQGKLHDLCGIPIFAGIPLAALASAVAAARSKDLFWACYSVGSSLFMAGSFLLFGASFGGVAHLAGKGGIYQRISIASGFGWLTALSFRALSCRHRAGGSRALWPMGAGALCSDRCRAQPRIRFGE